MNPHSDRTPPEDPRSRGSRQIMMLALVAAALVCLVRVGSTPLLETDEGFTANRAGSILRHDAWLLTYDDIDEDAPQFRKPPFLYWVIGGLYHVLGYNLWAVRLPTALSGVGLAVLLLLLHRRFLGRWVALPAALLPLAVPFYLHHVRTAMLDIPLLFTVFLGGYVFAFSRSRLVALLTLAATTGVALLIKKSGAFLCPLLAFSLVLVQPARRPRWFIDLTIACALSLLPYAAYYAALPAPYQAALRQQYLTRQMFGDVVPTMTTSRLAFVLGALVANMQGFVWLALAGIVLMLFAPRGAERRWLCAAVLLCVPLVLMTSRESVPYARYTLAVYPFVVALAAVAAFRLTDLKQPAWLAVPLALALALGDTSPWRWAAVAAVAVMPLAPRLPADGAARPLLGGLLLVAVGVALWGSPASRALFDRYAWEDMSVPAQLAAEATADTPPDQPLIIHGRFKLHNVLWHGRRPLRSFERWLASDAAPGVRRRALSRGELPGGIPGLTVRVDRRVGEWRLSTLEVDTSPTLAHGFLLCFNRYKPSLRAALRLMDIGFDERDQGFLPHELAAWSRATEPVTTVRWRRLEDEQTWGADGPSGWLKPHSRYAATFAAPIEVCGFDLLTRGTRVPVTNLEYCAHTQPDGAWHTLVTITDQPSLMLELHGDRVEISSRASGALRVRHAPLTMDELMLVTTNVVCSAEIRGVNICRAASP